MINCKTREDLTNPVLEAISKGGVFYSEGYGRYLQSGGDEPLYMFDEDYVMLIVVKKRGPFRFARLPVEYLKYSEGSQPAARSFLDACMDYCRDVLKLHWIHHPETAARFQETPSRCVRIPYSNHILDTTVSRDKIWSDIGKKNRNRIKKGQELGVIYKLGGGELLEDFYTVYSRATNQMGFNPLTFEFFANQFDYLPDQIRVAVASHEGVLQGAEFCYFDTHMLYCMYGANIRPTVQGASNLLHWVLIEDAIKQHIRRYSLVGARVNPAPGSKHESINKFKSSIIHQVEPCFLFKVALNPAMYKLFRTLDRMRTFLGWEDSSDDIIDQEIGQWLDMNEPQPLYDVYGSKLPQYDCPSSDKEQQN